MNSSDVPLGRKLAEGKTKIVYAHAGDPDRAVIAHKDNISAGDGARRNVIPGKGALSGRTTANVFHLLNAAGVPTHFVDSPEPDWMIVRQCQMIPVEVVMRRRATGSYLKRHPEVSEGLRFDPVLVEYYLKDDARHDPQLTAEELARQNIASPEESAAMAEQGRRVFGVLEQAWAAQDVQLVDLKIEFGLAGDGTLLVADVIDNDSWRLWPGGEKARQLDKQIYREMAQVDQAGLDLVRSRYEQVAAMTDRFVAPAGSES